MSEDCIFCGIVAGDVPSFTVYEDDTATAFLDANPLAKGHTVVVPNDHYERVGDMPDDVAGGLFQVINRVTPAVEAAVDAPATTVAFNNGEVAGQEIPHTHCHVVPRFEGDGARAIHAMFRGVEDVADEEMSALAADIRDHR